MNFRFYNAPAAKRCYTVGWMQNIFSEVDVNDARAAIRILLNEIVKTYHYSDGYSLKPKIYSGYDELIEFMRDDTLAVLCLNTFDYLYFGEKMGLEPILIPKTKGDIFEQYTLLVRKDNYLKNIKDLKNKSIGLLQGENHIASKLWLDIYLAKENIPDKTRFFKNIFTSAKETQLILDLFFGRLDACIVSTGALKLMAELNPQISEIVESKQFSQKYLWGLTCFTKAFTDAKDRNIFYNSSLQVNELNSGKQLFSMVKISKLEPFKIEYLNSYKDLIKEYTLMVKAKRIKNSEIK